mmetsp:Transcript_36493/g.46841  ORF Transcript_36493/g.46841 Transcript_36493/m.46841 type:complete len:593 (+) Transcript_36493:113-1891(+)
MNGCCSDCFSIKNTYFIIACVSSSMATERKVESFNAVDLYQKNGHLVLLGIPTGTDLGIDCRVYETGTEFRGVKLIPPGLHFVFYGARGGGGRQGFFLKANPGDVIVRSWDPSAEDLSEDSGLSDESFENLQQAVHRFELDGSLGPYPKEEHGTWKSLSKWITEDVLKTTNLKIGSKILPGTDDLEDLETNEQQKQVQNQITPYYDGLGQIPCFFDVKGGKVLDKEMSVEDRTKLNFDKTERLLQILQEEFHGDEGGFLGQVQLSFVLFLQLLSLPALKHWERLVHLVCHSHQLATAKPAFLAAFAQVLLPQLALLPEDFFAADISKENFLGPAFSDLFQNLQEPEINSQLQKSLNKLLIFVKERFGLFSSDQDLPPEMIYCLDDEDLPAVVSETSDIMESHHNDFINNPIDMAVAKEAAPSVQILPSTKENMGVVNRWQAIDEALSTVNKPQLQEAKQKTSNGMDMDQNDAVMEISGSDSDDEEEPQFQSLPPPPGSTQPAQPEGLEAKYPKLHHCIDSTLNEDIFMAAARLLSAEFQPDSTFKALAQNEARKFLEEEVQQTEAEVNQSKFWEKEMKRNNEIYSVLIQKTH